MRKLILLFLFNLVCAYVVQSQHNIRLPKEGDKLLLNKEWYARCATDVVLDGNALTASGESFRGWMPATVPGTVLTTLLNNGQIPSPYFGMNNTLIPDIYDTGKDHYTYWFVNRFTVDKPQSDGIVWLNFRGINYRAEIFLNGKRINTSTHVGMFHRTSYNISSAIRYDSINTLAVLVAPPDFPGKDNGGQGGDGQIARNVGMHFTPGWDWIQAVKDRNTGIWDEVSITQTGSVRICNPHLITKVPGVRLPSGKQADAVLKVSTELQNNSNSTQTATVTYNLEGQQKSMSVQLKPRETKEVHFPDLPIKNPRLWWPNGIGKQELYTLKIQANTDGGKTSDMQDVRFGVREITTRKDPATGGREFSVNGQKIFIRGGNYIASDWMLQLSEQRYRTEVKFHADMNLNMIRVWGGALPERPEFYKACDEYGILVFQDLSVTGDANGAWIDPKKKDSPERRRAYPDDHVLFLDYVKDQVKLLRNHPSLALWCGGNEWPAAEDIDFVLKNDLMPVLDPERHFTSYSTDTVFTRNTIGGVGDGPYGIQEPDWFFNFRSTPFNPELGSVGVPEARAMRAIMSEADLNDFPKADTRKVNEVWDYHKYIGYNQHIERYGQPKSGEEFCDLAQLINYDQYRTFMEGWGAHMWEWYTGMLIWKTQNPWTALRGQMYDWFLDQNACYYGTRKGCEPLHVQYNLKTKEAEVVNTGLLAMDKMKVVALWYNLHGEVINRKEAEIKVSANTVSRAFPIEEPQGIDGVYFLRLQLSQEKELVSDNIYWHSTRKNDYTGLSQLPKNDTKVISSLNKDGDTYRAKVTIHANSAISFFNRIYVLNKRTGERILPVEYSDNYVTVFPKEEIVISLTFKSDLPQEDILISVSSRN